MLVDRGRRLRGLGGAVYRYLEAGPLRTQIDRFHGCHVLPSGRRVAPPSAPKEYAMSTAPGYANPTDL